MYEPQNIYDYIETPPHQHHAHTHTHTPYCTVCADLHYGVRVGSCGNSNEFISPLPLF